MHSFFDSAVLGLTLACSFGLAFITQKMALVFLLKALDPSDRTIASGVSSQA
jgi:hypothetical protein